MTATVMPAETAEWIREHAWTGSMREVFREVPSFFLSCACESGLTHWCRTGRHGKCHRGTALPSSETAITDSIGCTLYFRRLAYRNAVRTSAIGPQRIQEALVWLGDRVCRWLCPCPCHLAAGLQLALDDRAGLFEERADG
jgi:hypothetical protein